MNLFNELQRRNVFRVTIAYIVSAWLLAQVADLVLDNITAPDWVMQTILLVLALGLAPVVFFSWAYEVTPEGVKRESEIDRTESITHVTGRKLDRTITVVLAIAVAYFAVDKFFLESPRPAPEREPVETEAVTEETGSSIAVLPFVNMSDDEANEYFSDGLSEELLNVLAKNPDLRVAARTSSFSLKGEKLEIGEIAERLKVDHVLEGSVRKSGDQVRITAQLIRGDNGYHLWSETYDRNLDNIFEVQDEIAGKILAALLPQLVGDDTQSAAVVVTESTYTPSPDAYQRYLLARDAFNKRTRVDTKKAWELAKELVREYPDYADAQAFFAHTTLMNTMRTGGYLPWIEAEPVIRRALDRAHDLDPNLPEAYLVEGMLHERSGDLSTAQPFYEKAIELNPSYAEAWRYLSGTASELGDNERAWEALETARQLDPISPSTLAWVFFRASDDGKQDMADDALTTLRQVAPETGDDLELHYFINNDRIAEAAIALENFRANWPEAEPHDIHLARVYAQLGLLEEAMALNRTAKAIISAEQGDRETALAVVEEAAGEYTDPHDRADQYWKTYLALDMHDKALEVLSDLWYGYAGEDMGPKMDSLDVWVFTLLLQEAGRHEEAGPVIDSYLASDVVQQDSYELDKLMLDGKQDEAMALVHQYMDEGNYPVRYTAVNHWLFPLESHPEYARLDARLQDWRKEQRALYEAMKTARDSAGD